MVSKGRSQGELEDLFFGQQEAMDCVPVSLRSIWLEWADRNGITRDLTRTRWLNATYCDPEDTGSSARPSSIRNELRDRGLLKVKKQTLVHEAAKTSSLDRLEQVLEDSKPSFPVVSVESAWWDHDSVPCQDPRGAPGGAGHCVIALESKENAFEIYDPYIGGHSGEIGMGFFTIPRRHFIQRWEGARPTREMMWFESTGEPPGETLEHYL